jgi:hypothetical protein
MAMVNKNGIDFAALGEPNLKASQFFSQLLSDTKHGYLAAVKLARAPGKPMAIQAFMPLLPPYIGSAR